MDQCVIDTAVLNIQKKNDKNSFSSGLICRLMMVLTQQIKLANGISGNVDSIRLA